MKKNLISVISAFIAAALTMVMIVIPTVATDTPVIRIEDVSADAGQTVQVDVFFENNPGIASFTLGFEYDESALTLTAVELSENVGGQCYFAKKAVWYAFDDYDYDGVWLTLTFEVSADASGEYQVTPVYSLGDICNYAEEDVAFTTSSGMIKIGTDVLWGDVNNDKAIDGTDAMLLNRYTSGWGEDDYSAAANLQSAGDINNDGAVDGTDAMLLNRYTSGWGEDDYSAAVNLLKALATLG